MADLPPSCLALSMASAIICARSSCGAADFVVAAFLLDVVRRFWVLPPSAATLVDEDAPLPDEVDVEDVAVVAVPLDDEDEDEDDDVVLARRPRVAAFFFVAPAAAADAPSSSKLLASGACSARNASASGPASGPPSP